MRKIAIILFVLLLFISQGGYHVIYSLRQYQLKEAVKEQMIARLPDSSLEVITIDENMPSFIWEEEGREFSLHGQLYDVARIKTVNGKKVLLCLKDGKEQQLVEERSATQSAGNANATDKSNGHTIKFQLNDCITEQADHSLPIHGHVCGDYCWFNAILCSSVKEVASPPPQS